MLNRKLICTEKRNLATLSENWINRINHLVWQKNNCNLSTEKAKWFAMEQLICQQLHKASQSPQIGQWVSNLLYYYHGPERRVFDIHSASKKVSKYVDVLKQCGAQRGSKIYISLPNTIAPVYTILACGALRAIFDFHYYGAGANDITTSPKSTDPMLIVTTSCIIEAVGFCEYKAYVDKVRQMVNKEIKCPVIKREYKQISNLSENGIDFDELKWHYNTAFEYAE